MSDSFDPYLRWLQIDRSEEGVDHYRLLEVESYEFDADVINAAAHRQISRIELAAGPDHDQLRAELTAEIIAARDCLNDTQARLEYDKTLSAARITGDEQNQGQPEIRIADDSVDVESEILEAGSIGCVEADGSLPSQANSDSSAGNRHRSRSRKRRRKRGNSLATELIGWIFGAILAVGFAYLLLHSDLPDFIRSHWRNLSRNFLNG